MAMARPSCHQKTTFLHGDPIFMLHSHRGILLGKASALTQQQLHGNGNKKPGGIDVCGNVRRLGKQDRLKKTLPILDGMDLRRSGLDSSTYISLLQGCLDAKSLREGQLVHGHMVNAGFSPDASLGTKLVIMYAKFGSLVDARRVLDAMPNRNVVSWTAMTAGYAQNGHCEQALALFYQMQQTGVRPNQFTFASVLPACANLAALKQGREIHGGIIRCGFQYNVFVGSALVDMYVKSGRVRGARQVFDRMPERNVVAWNAMIGGYAQSGHVDDAVNLFQKMSDRNVVSWTAMIAAYARHGHDESALTLFCQMGLSGVRPNQFTFASVLPACANMALLEGGKEIHEDIIRSGFQSDTFVGNALVDMYAKSKSVEEARKVFDKMPERNVVSWTAMIGGYAENGHVDESLKLFQKMPDRNVVSWNMMIAGCVQNGFVDIGLELFQKMSGRDVVSWNAMIAGYVQNGHFNEALIFFRQMQLALGKPNSVTFVSVLSACANLAALENGKNVHEYIIRTGFVSDIFVGNALMDMYAKCGSIDYAHQVFNKMPERDVVSWTTMIVGYAMNGCGKIALQLFEQMQHNGTKPNHVTFIGVLSACCHAGLIDDGWQYFACMSRDYHIIPTVDHYCCMVDLLGRAGCLNEARDFINQMPINPDAAVWVSLLGACRIHGNLELAQYVAEHLFELDPKNAAHYVLLSNIYAAAGRWDDVEKVRKLMKDRMVKNRLGCSWIEVRNNVYAFHAGDTSHPQTHQIYAKLEKLSGQMKEAGYVPETNFVLHNVE